MKPPAFLALALILPLASAHEFHHVDGWLTPPSGLEHPGDSHGEIDVDSEGRIYVSVTGGEKAGIQVYSADGGYLRNVPNARNNHHGFTIASENGKDVIYAACLGGDIAAIKLTLDGEVLLEIPNSAIPREQWGIVPWNQDAGPKLALTDIDVAPDGDIYLIDGYASDKIFRFSGDGKFKEALAGKADPWGFNNAHKFAVDPRFEPARLLVCDRNNRRLVHLSLDGEMLGEFAGDLLRPSAVDFHGDLVAVAEINGRVSILGKKGEVVARMGHNETEGQVDTNKVPPADWREGTVTSPHGIAFDAEGNVLMTEWNNWGRVLRWNHQHD